MKQENSRNSALDITRIFALFCVVSVHFFLNNGFYQQKVEGINMFIMFSMRSLFMVCVPLFLVLTGYLMNKKELSKKYYKGIIKTISIYILASICCLTYDCIFNGKEFNPLSFLDFSAAKYSWYVEMYIGLFLIIPFLNLIYNGLDSRKKKIILIITMLAITMLPVSFNIHFKIFPAFFNSLYPITYYFIGAFLSEYKIKIKPIINVGLIVTASVIIGFFNYYMSYGSTFRWAGYNDWGSLQCTVMTTLVFILLSSIRTDNFRPVTRNILANISSVTFGAYLVSYIFDNIFYPILNGYILDIPSRLPYYFIIVPCVFLCSIILSYVLDKIYFMFKNIIGSIVERSKVHENIN